MDGIGRKRTRRGDESRLVVDFVKIFLDVLDSKKRNGFSTGGAGENRTPVRECSAQSFYRFSS